jgi:hypothetical protein
MIAKYYLKNFQDGLKSGEIEKTLLADNNGNKVLKNILLLNEDFIDFYCDEFGKLFIKNLAKVLNSKASFVLLGLIEKGGRDYLIT